MSRIKELQRLAFWASALSEAEADRALRGISERSYPAGGSICHKGDRLEHWTGVQHGLVKIAAVSADGRAMTFAGIGAGGWFGEGSVIKKEPRKYDLVALRDTRLALLNQATFDWLFYNSPGFNRFLVHQLNERMGQFIATIEYDRILDATPRVARHIAWLLNPVLYPHTGSRIEISQEELALLAGVSRQQVSRALQALESAALIEVSRGGLLVRDVGRLASFGG